jgi:hypothetical protein
MVLAFITMLLVKHGNTQKIDFKKFFKKKVWYENTSCRLFKLRKINIF